MRLPEKENPAPVVATGNGANSYHAQQHDNPKFKHPRCKTQPAQAKARPTLNRSTFRTSRLLDFASEKELIAQTGHRPEAWPVVVLKRELRWDTVLQEIARSDHDDGAP